MQDDFRNCEKEKPPPPPPPWPDATPESFANALKMWEKEVRENINHALNLFNTVGYG